VGEVIAKQMKKSPMWGKLRPDSTQKYSFMSKNLNWAKKKLHNVRTGNVYTCRTLCYIRQETFSTKI
jgi:hypothetical protein